MRHKDEFPIEMISKELKISPSAYYEWCPYPHVPRAERRLEVLEFILQGCKDPIKQFFGSPRWAAELRAARYLVSKTPVARLMKSQGICALKRSTFRSRTDSRIELSVA